MPSEISAEILHEMALDAIKDVSGMQVAVDSLKETMKEHKKELVYFKSKFEMACERLTEVSATLKQLAADKVESENRIKHLEEAAKTQHESIQIMINSMKLHSDNHCDDCPNESRITALEDQPDNLVLAREIIQKPWPMFLIRALDTKLGMIYVVSSVASLAVQAAVVWVLIKVIANWDTIEKLQALLKVEPR